MQDTTKIQLRRNGHMWTKQQEEERGEAQRQSDIASPSHQLSSARARPASNPHLIDEKETCRTGGTRRTHTWFGAMLVQRWAQSCSQRGILLSSRTQTWGARVHHQAGSFISGRHRGARMVEIHLECWGRLSCPCAHAR